MSLLTTWGYTLTDVDTLPDLLAEAEFDEFTAGKYSGDKRIGPALAAASAAARNYCGWHLYPALACSITERVLLGDGRIKAVGPDLLLQLPATCVTEVASAEVDGTPWTDLALDPGGILHLFDANRRPLSRRAQIVVQYTAGIPEGLTGAIKEIIAHRVTHALAVPAGVASEAAGGVSITYSANWTNNVRATALPDDNKEVLEPYRVRGVF